MQFNGIWIKCGLMGFGHNCGFECLPSSLVRAGTAWVFVSWFASTSGIPLECQWSGWGTDLAEAPTRLVTTHAHGVLAEQCLKRWPESQRGRGKLW